MQSLQGLTAAGCGGGQAKLHSPSKGLGQVGKKYPQAPLRPVVSDAF